MTEPTALDAFEAQLAERARAYTDAAIARRIDPLEVSRTAMASRPSGGPARLATDPELGRVRWVSALAAMGLIVALVVVVRWGPSETSIAQPSSGAVSSTGPAVATGPVPEVLRHPWQRPAAILPGLDAWGSGFARLTDGGVEFGADPTGKLSRSAIGASGRDTLVATATGETQGCPVGGSGSYRWSVTGSDTALTLTAIDTDACPVREAALAGSWVRADLTGPAIGGDLLQPGTHETSAFDPFGVPGSSGQLSYTVPEDWSVGGEDRDSLVLRHPLDAPAGAPPADVLISLVAGPRVLAYVPDVACNEFSEDAHVGGGVDEMVAAIVARPGVISTPPEAITIGGFQGTSLDLRLAPSWTGGCRAPEGPIVGMPILHVGGTGIGPVVGLGPDQPVRLILLTLGGGRTMALTIVGIGPSGSPPLDDLVAQAMPIVESIEFHPPAPRPTA